ncbi:MAG: hypothetical protein DCF22_00270 [Leptolyngbya sp.]|nr:MAG: hypothetical protein DCF22_00270 [Leptolyngbya sp.]
MAGYKDYRSVTEFPLHTDELKREELETSYKELRDSYRSLTISRGQLVRRQTEAKQNLVSMNQKLQMLGSTLEAVQQEKQRLQNALVHSSEMRSQVENWGNDLAVQVDALTDQMQATTKLLETFESAYEEVKAEGGIFTIWQRFSRLLAAANRLLNTDISSMVPKAHPIGSAKPEEWTDETPANINRSLLDDQ